MARSNQAKQNQIKLARSVAERGKASRRCPNQQEKVRLAISRWNFIVDTGVVSNLEPHLPTENPILTTRSSSVTAPVRKMLAQMSTSVGFGSIKYPNRRSAAASRTVEQPSTRLPGHIKQVVLPYRPLEQKYQYRRSLC